MRRFLAALLLGLLAAAASAAAEQARDPAVSSLTIFAGARSGLWRSRDWGTTWERVLGRGAGASLDRVGALRCILPLGPLVYVAGEGGVFASTDFGETWTRVAAGAQCNALLGSRYPQSDGTLFLATPDGLLRSTAELLLKPQDAPRLFAPTGLAGAPVLRLEWPGPALIATGAQGVWISIDSGATFTPAGPGLPEGEVRALAASSYYAVDPVMFVAVGKQGVFRSPDGGRRWLPAGLAGRAVSDLAWLGPLLYAATDAGLYRSEDLGKTWTTLGEGLAGRVVTRLLFPLVPASAEAFLGTDRGVFWSGDGGLNWLPSGTSLLNEEILALATFPAPEPRSSGKPRR